MLDLFDSDAPPQDGANCYRWGTPDSSVHDAAVDQLRAILSEVRDSIDRDEIGLLSRQAEQVLADNAVVIPVAAGHTWSIETWYRVDL